MKENFCGLCVAAPLALLGGPIAGYSLSSQEQESRQFWIVLICALLVIISIYFVLKYSKCRSCIA